MAKIADSLQCLRSTSSARRQSRVWLSNRLGLGRTGDGELFRMNVKVG